MGPAQDEGFHEIQLNGKQLVFLFMAATVVSVVIFLCGVLVGRDVAERKPGGVSTALNDSPSADAARETSGSVIAPGQDPTVAPAPPLPPRDDLSEAGRVGKPATPTPPPASPVKPDPSKGYVWGLDPYDIYTANPDGTGLSRLTNYGVYTAEGTLSPDGQTIAFTSLKDGDLDIYTMKIDGTNVKRLTTAPGYDGGPFWSHDGKRIVYRAWHPSDTALTQPARRMCRAA